MKVIIGPSAEGEYYFERIHLNEQFWKKLAQSHHISIAAPRRVGKSSFMLNLPDKKGYKNIYLITESINEPNEFFKKIYKTLLGQLNTGGKFKQFFEDIFKRLEIKKISFTEIEFGKNGIEYFDEIMLLCKEVKESPLKIVLLIDEYSQTVENIITDQSKETARNFLHQCRELRQSPEIKSKISFVYTGSIGLENLVLSIDEPRSISDLGHFTIPPLSREEARLIVEQIIDKDPVSFSAGSEDYLFDKLNWLLPFFIHVIMGEIEAICIEKNTTTITNAIVDQAFDKALHNRSYFEHWLVRLRTVFKGNDFSCAKEILKIATLKDGIDQYELQDSITKYGIEDAAPLINILEHDGYLVKENASHKYRFNSPLLKAWWKKNIVI